MVTIKSNDVEFTVDDSGVLRMPDGYTEIKEFTFPIIMKDPERQEKYLEFSQSIRKIDFNQVEVINGNNFLNFKHSFDGVTEVEMMNVKEIKSSLFLNDFPNLKIIRVGRQLEEVHGFKGCGNVQQVYTESEEVCELMYDVLKNHSDSTYYVSGTECSDKNLQENVLSRCRVKKLIKSGNFSSQDFNKIPEVFTIIREEAFKDGLNGLNYKTSIDLNNVKTVGDKAFYGNVYIGMIALGEVENIGESAFEGCTSMQSVIAGSSIDSIGKDAFKDCGDIVEVRTGSEDVYNKIYQNMKESGLIVNEIKFYVNNEQKVPDNGEEQ